MKKILCFLLILTAKIEGMVTTSSSFGKNRQQCTAVMFFSDGGNQKQVFFSTDGGVYVTFERNSPPEKNGPRYDFLGYSDSRRGTAWRSFLQDRATLQLLPIRSTPLFVEDLNRLVTEARLYAFPVLPPPS